ncbi:MAG TPA: YggS family pyridoxal phosphate-dependent enzyme [Spirochaetales bacterium]|nr:YggS family pyridoxal phosphate-dependent enzyme [Spirochaetales bacterium]HPG86128.1 YggS family pyridoxal phosphate-dependent enzyme [Spirochaetales bacterium]
MTDDYRITVAQAVENVLERMGAACARAGRSADEVRLLAVTKFHPYEAVEAAYAAGVRLFGENRVQEAEAKFSAGTAPKGAFVHLLGHLQSNKAKRAAALFDCVQSIDSIEVAAELAKRAAALGKTLDVLLELHTGEESKTGFASEDALLRALEAIMPMPSLKPRGLMTMAPFSDDAAVVRASFRTCRRAFEVAMKRFAPVDFSVLSMGMSNDFELAVEEGSTMVRVGTAIFGSRRLR